LPAAVIKQLADRTDGVPLYVEEMTKVVLESGILKETNGRYELSGSLSSLAIPATLQDSLMSRLDRLMTAKVIAQLGATIGRQFSYELLQAVSQLDDATLQRELGRLVEAELVYQRGLPPQATYTFKHALIQDAAYQALLKSTRQQYHQRLAQILEERFPETTASQPELVAHHYTESGLIEPAIAYWQRAGQQARQHSANLEAVAHLTRGLELLMRLPDTLARTQRELDFQMALCPVLMATRGYAAAEVGEAYTRMRTLCQHVGASPQLFSALSGLCIFHITRAELRTACELAEQFLSLAQQQPDPVPLLVAHQVLGTALFYQGEFAASHQHLAQGIALYNPQQHHALIVAYGHDVGVVCLSYAALALGCLGALDEALKRSHEALTLAQEVSHPYSLAWAFNHAARFHHFRREDQMVYERTEVSVALSTEKGFGQFAAADTILRGWVEARQEHGTAGIAHMRQGVAAWQASGAVLRQAYWLSMLAEVYGKHGEAQEGLRVLAEAQEEMNKTDEQWYKAELHRLKGELLLLQSSDNHTEAETSFHQAITIARHQQAKFWELRATTSLARLWQSQDKRQDAYDLLAPVYEWFSEGFDTADFMDAKQLLAKLSVESSSQTG
jgi:predicted ATPase